MDTPRYSSGKGPFFPYTSPLAEIRGQQARANRPRGPPGPSSAIREAGRQSIPSSVSPLSPDEPLERFAELARDGPGLAAADHPSVDLDDRDDLGGGAGQEAFVGGVDVVARQRQLLHGDA